MFKSKSTGIVPYGQWGDWIRNTWCKNASCGNNTYLASLFYGWAVSALMTSWQGSVFRFSVIRFTLHWRHDDHDGVSNHQPHDCLLKRLFRRRSKKASKLGVTGFCVGNSPGTGEFPAQRASNAENVSIWWRHQDQLQEGHRHLDRLLKSWQQKVVFFSGVLSTTCVTRKLAFVQINIPQEIRVHAHRETSCVCITFRPQCIVKVALDDHRQVTYVHGLVCTLHPVHFSPSGCKWNHSK